MSAITSESLETKRRQRIIDQAVRGLRQRLGLQDAIARAGSPTIVTEGGYYDDDNNWVEVQQYGEVWDGSKPCLPG